MITARLNLTVMIVTDLLILSEILHGEEKITLKYKQNQKMVLIILKMQVGI